MICRAFVLLAVMFVAVSGFTITYDNHNHTTCTSYGIVTIPADLCKGFHFCGYDIATGTFVHRFYLKCWGTLLYNGFACVPPWFYTCPT